MAIETDIKRKYPRFPTDLTCLFRSEGTFAWESGELLNLSKGGVCIKSKTPPAKDAIIEIEIDLFTEQSGWKKRKMKARVMWRRGKRAGLHFVM
ncbi:MAG TPA: PilZ domain-containing protein [Bdellovibrio sp.]|nr:PilZ domain-containing protein [Bdellovibrio sp.]